MPYLRHLVAQCASVVFLFTSLLLVGCQPSHAVDIPPATAPTTRPTALRNQVIAQPVADSQPAKPHGIFWKVTSPTTTVYLLGSMHLATPDVYPLAPEIEKAFNESSTLVLEIDEGKVDQLQMIRFVTDKGMYKGDDELSKHVSAETMKAVSDFCDKNKIPAIFARMKPFMAAITLEVMAMQKAGFDPQLGIDKHFQQLAKKQKKEIVELESAQQQLDMLANLDDKVQDKFLASTVDESQDMKSELGKLLAAWKSGDVQTLLKIGMKGYDSDPEIKSLDDIMIFDRNVKMAGKIEAMLKGDKPAFVVVGALHLVGDNGIVNLLAKDHFKVEQPALTPAPPAPESTATAPAKPNP